MSRKDTAGVIAPPPLVYLAFLGAGFGLHRWHALNILPFPIPSGFGWTLIGAALCFFAWSRRTMTKRGTPLNPYKPSTTVVPDGPYRFTRNPIYLCMTAVYLGVVLLLNALWPLLLLPVALAVVHFGVILREERYLEAKFGDAYREYKARVRRWI